MAVFPAYQEWIELIARSNPELILNHKPTAETQLRVQELVMKQSANELTSEEESELNYFIYLENMLGLAKARAYQLLHSA